ncbi:MAG: hypothetical protein SWY16_24310, partial [Cyanobacteriota bacterium]|nr:hypothetical protein [Cyanobacteriota bacterium]
IQESSAPTAPLVEATGWQTNDRGQVELVATSVNPSHSSWQPHPECETETGSISTSRSLEEK